MTEKEEIEEIDTSKDITIHTLVPSRRILETETDDHNVVEIDESIVDISNVFTGPEGDLILHNKGCPIPSPYDKDRAEDGTPGKNSEDPSVELMNREFTLGFYEKICEIPSSPVSLSLGSIPAWAIVLLFIVVIMVLGGV